MITALYCVVAQAGQQPRRVLQLRGHAGYAPAGQDIVCAGVSAVYETLRLALAARGECCLLQEKPGNCTLGGCGPAAEILYPAALQGLAAMAAKYPEHLCLHCAGKGRDKAQ